MKRRYLSYPNIAISNVACNSNVIAQPKYIRHPNAFNDLPTFPFLYTNVNLILIEQTSLLELRDLASYLFLAPPQIQLQLKYSPSHNLRNLHFCIQYYAKIIIVVIINQRSMFGVRRGMLQM